MLPPAGLVVRLGPRQVEHVGEEPLGQPVAPDDALGQGPPALGEADAAVGRDQPFVLEPAHHLAHRRAADLQPVGDARLDDVDIVLGQLEDRLAVLLEGGMVLSGGRHVSECTRGSRGAVRALPCKPEGAPGGACRHTGGMQSAAPLRARGVTVTRGPNVVLDSINLTVAGGETIGLVGPNGVGKSTLLGVLAGRIQPDRGSVELTPPTATVGLLPQEPRRDRVELVAGLPRAAHRGDGRDRRARRRDDRPRRPRGRRRDPLRPRPATLAVPGVADLPARIGEVWADLGLADDLLDQPTASLSGGEAARVGLAALLLSRFDVYLLDEPTNDLDLDGLDRLERWIDGARVPPSCSSATTARSSPER